MLFKAHFPAQNSHLSRAGIKKLNPRINMGDNRINYGINGLTQGSVGRDRTSNIRQLSLNLTRPARSTWQCV
jgi:hypothetical protein